MGVAVGLILIAFGAILTWAVDAEASGLNVTAVGVILLVIGILVVLLDLFWWRSGRGTRPAALGGERRTSTTPRRPFSRCNRAAGRAEAARRRRRGRPRPARRPPPP